MKYREDEGLKDILTVIVDERMKRGWTEYRLSECSGLPQSTISAWYRKNLVPSVPSLEKVCQAFNITMSQLFAECEGESVTLTNEQTELLNRWSRLDKRQQEVVFQLLDVM